MNTDTELLRKLVAEWREKRDRNGTTGYAAGLHECAEALDKALSRLLEAGVPEGWVKCSESPPPQAVDVWAYWPACPPIDADGFPALKEWVARANWISQRAERAGWHWQNYDYSGSQLPTHWMPLPHPPSEGEQT